MWHDLCEDDLILPAQGSEYVLKGSELLEDNHSGKQELGFIVTSSFNLFFIFLSVIISAPDGKFLVPFQFFYCFQVVSVLLKLQNQKIKDNYRSQHL